MIPKEGSSLFLDSLAIPAGAPHPELAHAFIDFTMEAEIAAEICRTMRYSTPEPGGACRCCPPAIRGNPAIFPPADVLDAPGADRGHRRGDACSTTALWTEVKTSR